MPDVDDALTDGRLTPAHVDALARATQGASAQVAATLASPQGQAQVVGLAVVHDARRFGVELAALTAGWDPQGAQDQHDQHRAARFLLLTQTPQATLLRGRLDPWAGVTLRRALEAVAGQPDAEDDRNPEQRTADALTAMAAAALDAPPARHSTERPHVSVLISEQTWTAIRSTTRDDTTNNGTPGDDATNRDATSDDATNRDATSSNTPTSGTPTSSDTARSAGSAAAISTALTGHEPARELDGTLVPASELGKLLCDCELSRMILSADGEILDLGRTTRLFAGPLRRAILLRDGGCAWPTCPAQARWIEIHHLHWWGRDNGTTSITNGVALCSFHHHLIHRDTLTITRHPTPEPHPRNPATTHPRARYTFHRPDGSTASEDVPP